MRFLRLALTFVSALAVTGRAAADESGAFVVRLGRDTVSVEQYTRSASKLVIEQVGRAPRVLRRHFVYDLAGGAIPHVSVTVTPPGAAAPLQSIEASADGESLRVEIRSPSAPARRTTTWLPRGAAVVAGSSPWALYEMQIAKLLGGKGDSLRTTMYFLGSAAADFLSLRRLGRDSVVIFTYYGDLFHARVDRAGRILGVLPISGTGKVSVDRVAKLDVDAMAASFAAREQAGAGLGTLSPRDTVRAQAGGASLWVDYGRPAMRGRVVFGGVVPYNEVWRTGANAATQFRTDQALDFGGVVVPAGFYTLWTIPSPGGWKLLVNGETGQWGTDHKPDRDLYTIQMTAGALPEAVERFTIGIDPAPQGGVLHFDWDTTRASAAFTVKP